MPVVTWGHGRSCRCVLVGLVEQRRRQPDPAAVVCAASARLPGAAAVMEARGMRWSMVAVMAADHVCASKATGKRRLKVGTITIHGWGY
jgi:hypothetical protein